MVEKYIKKAEEGPTAVLTKEDDLAAYAHVAISDSTRHAYQDDIKQFLSQGYSLPATVVQLQHYLRACATIHNPRTIQRRLIALRQWHRLQNQPDPTADPTVLQTLREIARVHGQPKRQAPALALPDLDSLLAHLRQTDALISLRDQALILVGFYGAFRRSELVALKWSDVQFVREGMIITIKRSKTDQTGQGFSCSLPYGPEPARCAVQALLTWRNASSPTSGAIFKRISKVGTLSKHAIGPRTVNHRLKQLAKAAGLPYAETISAHSLHRGCATEAARLGASLPAIQRFGRWRTTQMVVEYIEAGRQFADSALHTLYTYKPDI